MSRRYTLTTLHVASLIVIALFLDGCVAPSPQVAVPTPQVMMQGDTPGREEIQPIELYNCNGKGDAKRIEQRTRSIESTISAEIAARFGVSAEVLSADIQTAVGAAMKGGEERSTSIELVAPPGTWMAFQLVWIGDEQVGIVQNLRASNIPIAFRSFKPTDVRIKSQYDIGCPGPEESTGVQPMTVQPQQPRQVVSPTTAPTLGPTLRPPITPEAQKAKLYTFTLDAAHPEWSPTGFRIPAGTWLHFWASGRIRWDPSVSEPEVGPNGASWTPSRVSSPSDFLLPNVAIASLIAKIDDQVFPIGIETVINTETGGELYLGINERWKPGCWDDNSGHLQIAVEVVGQ
jgi:hypothetical protein